MTVSGEQPKIPIVEQDGTPTGATIESNVPLDTPATPESIIAALGQAAAAERPPEA